MEEALMHPDELRNYPLNNVKSLYTFPLSTLASAIVEKGKALTNKIGPNQRKIAIASLLYFEPYTCFSDELITRLTEAQTEDHEVSEDFLRDCAKVAHPKTVQLKEILLLPEHDSEYVTAVDECHDQFSNNPTHKCFHVFNTWKKYTKNSTYKELREALDKYSIFRGRNPLVSVCA